MAAPFAFLWSLTLLPSSHFSPGAADNCAVNYPQPGSKAMLNPATFKKAKNKSKKPLSAAPPPPAGDRVLGLQLMLLSHLSEDCSTAHGAEPPSLHHLALHWMLQAPLLCPLRLPLPTGTSEPGSTVGSCNFNRDCLLGTRHYLQCRFQ